MANGIDCQDVYKLLQYLICTNRVSLKKLKGSEKCTEDTNVDEYIIYNHDAAQEARFQRIKHKKGSIFTFHGSRIENWYSILRNGPRNLSNSKMMLDGATEGEGVYSSKYFSTSVGYCGGYFQRKTWNKSILSGKVLIGIIEVIHNKSYVKIGDYDFYVCPYDHHIMLRYLWVIP
jgi:hypothetical protein